jgi:hypothetical protein
MYLIHDGKYWSVVEKHTHKWVSKWQTTRRAMLTEVENFLTDEHVEKIKEYIDKQLVESV